jgi:hypothetical protein
MRNEQRSVEVQLRESHPEDIWAAKGAAYQVPYTELCLALAGTLAADWLTVWDTATRKLNWPQLDWYLPRQGGLVAWAGYAADFTLRQTGQTVFTAEDWYRFHFLDQIKCFGRAALADEYFRYFRNYEFETANAKFFRELAKVLADPGRRPNLEFLWFCFLWDRHVIPLEFWTNEAIASFYRAKTGDDGTLFYKEKIRNWKRELKLKEASSLLVRGWDDATDRIKLEKRKDVLRRIDKIYGIPVPRLPER